MPVLKGNCPTGVSGFANCSYSSNSFINFGGDMYAPDRCLYDMVSSEAINTYGFIADYIQTTSDTNYDKVFKEDPTRRMIRKFEIRMKYDLPTRQRTYSKWGALLDDTVIGLVSKESFKYNIGYYETIKWWERLSITVEEVTKLGVKEQISPKAGDIIYFRDNDLYYEIVDFDDRQDGNEMNYGHSPVWYIYLKQLKDEHLSYVSEISKEELNNGIGNIIPVSSVDTTTETEMGLNDYFDIRYSSQAELSARSVEYEETDLIVPPDETSKPFTPLADPLAKANGKFENTEEEYLKDIGWN